MPTDLVEIRRDAMNVAADHAGWHVTSVVQRRDDATVDNVVAGEIFYEPLIMPQAAVAHLLTNLVPAMRPSVLQIVGRHGNAMEYAAAGWRAARIVDALIASGTEHALGDAAAAQGVEIIQHVAQAVGGHEFEHDGMGDFLAGVKHRLLLQVVVAHHEAEGRQRRAFGPLQHGFGHAVDEFSQNMRMNGADHGVPRLTLLTAAEFHPDRAARRGQHRANLGVAAHLSAVVLDAPDQLLPELAAAADRLRDAESMHQTRHQEHAKARSELVRQLQVLAHQPQQPDLYLLALEPVVGDLQRTALH